MSLMDYYKLTFQLMHHHKYSLTELEYMIPWERDVYISQVIEYIEVENERLQLMQMEALSKARR